MDESSIYLDSPSTYTYDVTGSRRIKATTTGNEKTRLSAAFSAVADGFKLPVFVIIPRVRTIAEIEDLECIIAEYQTGGTFNDEMIVLYLERIVVPYMLRKKFNSILLVIDQAKCHMTAKVKDFCRFSTNLFYFFIAPLKYKLTLFLWL